MKDMLTTTSGRRYWAVSALVFSVGCAGGDPTGPTDPAFEPLAITTNSLPDGAVDVAYGARMLTATGGDGSYSWAVASGRHPAGLSLSADGVMEGTPRALQTSSFTVQVTSGDGQTARQAFSIQVNAPQVLGPADRCGDHPPYARATFEDTHLEAAVRGALSVGAQDPLTCGALATLYELDARSRGIAHLGGIQNLTSLVDLELSDNGITDISALGGLRSLVYLSLYQNAIGDISALGGLTGLEFLNLNHNSVEDLGPLAGLTDLWILFLGNNAIGDIGPLAGLTDLENLSLEDNPITDIQALSVLTGLTDLRLGGTSIADYGPLGALTRLEYLGLAGNSITDVTALSQLLTGHTRLWYLSLSDNSIRDLVPLGALTSLTYLGLSGNSFDDISALAALTRLAKLYLTDNSITDVGPLKALTGLTYLGLSDNPELDDIHPLLENAGLGAGVAVTLFRTSVGCTDVAALRARDVTVHTSGCP